MIYRVIRRVLQKHVFFHLLIPLVVGVLIEAAYANLRHHVPWTQMPGYLLSAQRIALYAGIVITYICVVALLLKTETTIGMRRMQLDRLAEKLRGAKSLFAVAPTPLKEWFDPAAQVYFTTILGEWLASAPHFRYERVLLLPERKTTAHADLESPFFDGYYARCLLRIHEQFGIDLYFLDWDAIRPMMKNLSKNDKVLIGYYPKFASWLPAWLAGMILWPVRRRRIRRIAGGVVEDAAGTSTFHFAKRENVVDVEPQDVARSNAYLNFVALLRAELYAPNGEVKTECNLAKFNFL